MDAERRFLDKVMVIAGMEDACHLWTAQLDKDGYGQFAMTYKDKWQAHRAAYQLFVGPIPAGKIVMHTCDQPRCVNPDHLKVGTQADNMADKMAKGRWRGGRPKKS